MSPPFQEGVITVRNACNQYMLVCSSCGRRSISTPSKLAMFPCACGAVCCGKVSQVAGNVNIRVMLPAALCGRLYACFHPTAYGPSQQIKTAHSDDFLQAKQSELRENMRNGGGKKTVLAPSSLLKCRGKIKKKCRRQNVFQIPSTSHACSSQSHSASCAPTTDAEMKEGNSQLWGQCDICDKWRTLPTGFEVPSMFVCSMICNMTCKIPEECWEEIEVLEFEGLLCTEFQDGLWRKTNSLKVLLEGFESKGLVRLHHGVDAQPFPFFNVNGKQFSSIEVVEVRKVYETLCYYIRGSPIYVNHRGHHSTCPDGRAFNLFNDLGFKSSCSPEFAETGIKVLAPS